MVISSDNGHLNVSADIGYIMFVSNDIGHISRYVN